MLSGLWKLHSDDSTFAPDDAAMPDCCAENRKALLRRDAPTGVNRYHNHARPYRHLIYGSFPTRERPRDVRKHSFSLDHDPAPDQDGSKHSRLDRGASTGILWADTSFVSSIKAKWETDPCKPFCLSDPLILSRFAFCQRHKCALPA